MAKRGPSKRPRLKRKFVRGSGARVASDTLRDDSKDCSTDADEQCGADDIADVTSSVAEMGSAAQIKGTA